MRNAHRSKPEKAYGSICNVEVQQKLLCNLSILSTRAPLIKNHMDLVRDTFGSKAIFFVFIFDTDKRSLEQCRNSYINLDVSLKIMPS